MFKSIFYHQSHFNADSLIFESIAPFNHFKIICVKKRLQKMHESNFGGSLFHEDIFYWDQFQKEKNNSLGQFFRLKRIKKLISRHESLLTKWIDFVHK